MNLRRLCLALMVLVTLLVTGLGASFLSGCATAAIDSSGRVEAGITFYAPPRACPPLDGSTWRYEPTWLHADRVMWVSITRANPEPCEFDEVPAQWIPSRACAYTQTDRVGVVYSTQPRFTLTEAYIHHEECHTQGWTHGPHQR